jgi:hypothetical protein
LRLLLLDSHMMNRIRKRKNRYLIAPAEGEGFAPKGFEALSPSPRLDFNAVAKLKWIFIVIFSNLESFVRLSSTLFTIVVYCYAIRCASLSFNFIEILGCFHSALEFFLRAQHSPASHLRRGFEGDK